MSLEGSGLIDGRGQKWWDLPCKPHKVVILIFRIVIFFNNFDAKLILTINGHRDQMGQQ
jgi:hypothetical protein